MTRRFITGLAVAAFILTGCVGSMQTAKNPVNISFKPVIGHDTRADESIPFPQDRSFKVWAVEQEGGDLYMENAVISYAGGGWHAPEIWGNETLRFDACWPSDLDVRYSKNRGIQLHSFDSSAGDVDVLAASTEADDRSSPLVTLNFEHILSRVQFRVIHSLQESMSLKINRITLSKVARKGSYNVARQGEWTDLEDYGAYVVYDDSEGALITSKASTYLGEEFYAIPQLTYGCVEVQCSIKYGTAGWIPQTYEIDPIEIVWDPGKHFIYTLNIRMDKMVHTLGISSMTNR